MQVTSQSESRLTNRITLPEQWVTFLTGQPETGMRYQDVTVFLTNGTTTNCLAINCEILDTVLAISAEDIVDIKVNPKKV
jgi:hypothetical protein